MSKPSNLEIIRPLFLKIEPRFLQDQDLLGPALVQLAREDVYFGFEIDPESQETLLHGVSELHLDACIEILLDRFGLRLNIGSPKVAYRETVIGSGAIDYTHIRTAHGKREYARVALNVAPRERGAGNEFISQFRDDPEIYTFTEGVEKGVRSVLDNGVLIGFPIIDVSVTWTDGSFDAAISDKTSFEIAARVATMEALRAANIKILEPVMFINVRVKPELVAVASAELNRRRGQIMSQKVVADEYEIEALVALAQLFGIYSALSSIGVTRHALTMRFDHYSDVASQSGGPNDPDSFPPAIGMRA